MKRESGRFGGLLFELIIIILGISISYGLNEWRIYTNDRAEELNILKELKQNLADDTTLIRDELNSVSNIIKQCRRLTAIKKAPISDDSLGIYFSAILSYSTISYNDLVYRLLKETGESKLITNRELLKDIISLYDKHYWLIKENNQIDAKVVLEQMVPFVVESGIDFVSVESVKKAVANDTRLNNYINLNASLKGNQQRLYAKQLIRIQDLIKKVDAEIQLLE